MQIPGAKLVAMEGEDHLAWIGENGRQVVRKG
jgi:hypothetical protein